MAYRQFLTSSNILVIAGKNAEQNERIVKQAKKEELVLHTLSKGSPFCVIKEKEERIDEKSIKEAAIFCAGFSKAFKKGKKIIEVHVFSKKDIYKTRGMPKGAYGVKKVKKRIRVKPILALGFKNGKIQCSPPSSLDLPLIKIVYGRLEKEKAAKKITELLNKKNIKISIEKVMQLVPAGKLKIGLWNKTN